MLFGNLVKILPFLLGHFSGKKGGISEMEERRSGLWRSLTTDGDFEEEDVWEVQNEREAFNSEYSTWILGQSTITSPLSVKRPLPSAARMIPRTASLTGSASFDSGISSFRSIITPTAIEANNHVMKQQSAPVNIPDWSKISGNRSSDNRYSYVNCEEDEYEQSKVPPHEILDRRMAMSQISSCSVFEGVGRKLKGRDLSKVRNDVLTKTGFLE